MAYSDIPFASYLLYHLLPTPKSLNSSFLQPPKSTYTCQRLIVVFFIFERTKSMLVAKWPPKPCPSHRKGACTCRIQFAKRPKVGSTPLPPPPKIILMKEFHLIGLFGHERFKKIEKMKKKHKKNTHNFSPWGKVKK